MTFSTEFDQAIGTAIATAEQAMQTAAGGQTVCEIHRSGRVTGGLKYQEGRLVALHNLRRGARKSGPLQGDVEYQTLLLTELGQWRDLLQQHQAAAKPSMPWIAYAQGGVDACTEILTRFVPAQRQGGQAIPTGTM